MRSPSARRGFALRRVSGRPRSGVTLLVRDVRLAADAPPVDVALSGERVLAVGTGLGLPEGVPRLEGGGGFAFPGFVESHIHLDKACILDRAPAGGALAEAIAGVARAKAGFTAQDVAERASRVLRAAIGHGATLMRTHVEVDPVVGLRGVEGVMEAARAHAWGVEVELCVFPQDGLTNLPGTEALMRAALDRGARVVGACPYTDPRPLEQLDIVFRLARDYDVDVDMHLDFDLQPSTEMIEAVCRRTEAAGWGGRVAIGHVTRLSALGPGRLEEAARRMADAGVALTVLPATDLFLMGRDADRLAPRGVAPAHRVAACGARCSLSTNNVLNPFTPFGDGSALRIAHLYAHVAQLAGDAELDACFAMVAGDAARLMGRSERRIEPGAPADIVILDAASPAEAVRTLAPCRAVVKAGRLVAERPPVRLFPWDRAHAEVDV